MKKQEIRATVARTNDEIVFFDVRTMKSAKQFESILKLSADSRETLRSSDVDRVMDAAHQAGVASEFGAWLVKKAQPATSLS